VLSAITDFAYTFNRDGRFVYVNKALLDLSPCSAQMCRRAFCRTRPQVKEPQVTGVDVALEAL
jgi:PAS domain-containing protein